MSEQDKDRAPRSSAGGVPKGDPLPMAGMPGHDPTGGTGHQAGARDTAFTSESGSSSGKSNTTGGGADSMKKQAQQTGEHARKQASELAGEAGEKARAAGAAISEQARDAGRKMRDYGESVLSDQKQRAAAELDGFGRAIHAAGDRLHDEEDDAIAGYVHALGEQVERASGYIREHNVGSMASDLRELARQRPEWFLGGAFLAGLAIARFAKAHEPGRQSYDYDRRYGDDYDDSDRTRREPNVASGSSLPQQTGDAHLYGTGEVNPGTGHLPEV